MDLTTREKIAHLLRRFGLGASAAELDFYEKLGVDGTIDRLINYEPHPDGIPFNPMTFAREQDGRKTLNLPQVAGWWTLRLLLSQRPLEEQLTLFWHDHFAVSASKVMNPPLMVQHVNTLRQNASGSFLTLLEAVCKDPAMIRWLDTDTNVRGKPNENFARELLELFTMGIGNYTEADIQEISRAFTGWGFRPNVDPREVRQGTRPVDQVWQLVEQGKQPYTFNLRMPQHDTGTKKFLGNEGQFDGETVIGILCGREETARYISSKLWSWFAYENPEEPVQKRLAKKYFDGRMHVKPILLHIAESDEFWSEKCVRRRVKNPCDFVIGLGRQLGIANQVPDAISQGEAGGRLGLGVPAACAQAMQRMGMRLLYPPDVAGWDHGTAWINSATMVERIKFADTLFGGPLERGGPRATAIGELFAEARNENEVVDEMLNIFDGEFPEDRRKALAEACAKNGGAEAARNPRQAAPMVQAVARVLFSAPEFQFC